MVVAVAGRLPHLCVDQKSLDDRGFLDNREELPDHHGVYKSCLGQIAAKLPLAERCALILFWISITNTSNSAIPSN